MVGSTLILNADGQPLSTLPISAWTWRKVIPEMWAGKASPLHHYEDWEVRSPSISLKVPSVMILNQFKTPKRLVRFTRRNIFLRDDFKCQYCREEFPYGKLTYDHVQPQSRGGKTTWANISSSCGPCNARRGNNGSILPAKMPYRPTYWELAAKAKMMPIVVPHESWMYYLDWPPELMTVRGREYSDEISIAA